MTCMLRRLFLLLKPPVWGNQDSATKWRQLLQTKMLTQGGGSFLFGSETGTTAATVCEVSHARRSWGFALHCFTGAF